jgi:hypothetical protein
MGTVGADTDSVRRWVGGMVVPRRVSTTFPVAVLEIASARLEMRIRPRWFRALLGAGTLEAFAGDGTVLFPVRLVGVGIRGPSRPTWYFRTFATDDILAVAAAAGFEVEASPRRQGT